MHFPRNLMLNSSSRHSQPSSLSWKKYFKMGNSLSKKFLPQCHYSISAKSQVNNFFLIKRYFYVKLRIPPCDYICICYRRMWCRVEDNRGGDQGSFTKPNWNNMDGARAMRHHCGKISNLVGKLKKQYSENILHKTIIDWISWVNLSSTSEVFSRAKSMA